MAKIENPNAATLEIRSDRGKIRVEGIVTEVRYPHLLAFDTSTRFDVGSGLSHIPTAVHPPVVTFEALPKKPRTNKLIPKRTAEEHGVRVYKPTIMGPIVTWQSVNLTQSGWLGLFFMAKARCLWESLYRQDPNELIVLPGSPVLKALGIPHITTRGHVFDVLARLAIAYERPEYTTEFSHVPKASRFGFMQFRGWGLLALGWKKIRSQKQADMLRRRAIKKRQKASSSPYAVSENAFLHRLLQIEVGNYYATHHRVDFGGIEIIPQGRPGITEVEALSGIFRHVDELVLNARPYQPEEQETSE